MMGIRNGIDLGTTNSAAAMVYEDGPHLIPRGAGRLIPSVVHLRWQEGRDDVVVGEEAANSRGRVVRSIKRLMGRTYPKARREGAEDHFGPPLSLRRRFGDDLGLAVEGDDGEVKVYWPHEISALILEEIKDRVEKEIGAPIESAVITVPAYFQDAHRAATLAAARLASIDVWEPLVDEPTAGALAFGRIVGLSAGEPLLVVDWGGGTFDVTLLMNEGEHWVQLGIDGDLNLGGDDIDLLLARMVLEEKNWPLELLDDEMVRHNLVYMAARAAKHRLSESEEASYSAVFPHPETGKSTVVATTIGRDELEEVIAEPVDRGLSKVQACLEASGVPDQTIKKVLLIGGSSRIPLLKRKLQETLPAARLHDEVDPMSAVALGAAIYAGMERPDVNRLCPYGYAVKAKGSLVAVIPPGTEVPTPPDLPFRLKPDPQTSYDGQTRYRLKFYRFTKHDRNLLQISETESARIFGDEFPPSPAGSDVGLELWLDENKVLRARIYPPGETAARDITASMMEIGEEALFTAVQDRTLEAHSLVEANRETACSLVTELEEVAVTAEEALGFKNREECETALASIEELLQQAAIENTNLPEKERVLGWAVFYEQALVPHFWNVISEEKREAAIERIRRINVMKETRSPTENLRGVLAELQEDLHEGPLGVVFEAYREAHVVGVPDRLGEDLEALADKAALHYYRGERESFATVRRELREKMGEAEKAFSRWRERGDITMANPDLRVVVANE
jgi:molecular chaperone DnaK